MFFRTELYGSLADASGGNAVALEADELDDRLSSGWSVVVLGRAEQVEDPAELAMLFRRIGQPWAPGSRPVLVRILPSQVTGRRYLREYVPRELGQGWVQHRATACPRTSAAGP